MSKTVKLRLPEEVVSRLENLRGDVPMSTYLRGLILNALNGEITHEHLKKLIDHVIVISGSIALSVPEARNVLKERSPKLFRFLAGEE